MDRCVVKILQSGYCRLQKDGKEFLADCTVSLITSNSSPILVDTSGPWNATKLVAELDEVGYKTSDIKTVVCTHGHSDHIGNLNLFPQAKFIVGFDVFSGNVYQNFDFKNQNAKYTLTEHIYVIPTPGHTHSDVSVVVENTDLGTIVIAGDIFENECDIKDPTQWQSLSENIELQQQSRNKILSLADYIVPGHGKMFCTKKI